MVREDTGAPSEDATCARMAVDEAVDCTHFLKRVSIRMDLTEINSSGKQGELLGRIDRQNSRFQTAKTIIIKCGLHVYFVELESAKNALNEWPANSPDLNPIEHVWDMLGREIVELLHPPRFVTKLKRALQEAWNRLSPQLIHHLIASMVNRCAACLAVGGDHTPY
ncbi:transposable element Tc3 transposase [Trichonephila clavipes]|nr:transposable element Tc3 transposase [Trichonephila clavipes]